MVKKLSDILTTFLQKYDTKQRKMTNRHFLSNSLEAPIYRDYTVFIDLE